MAYDLHIGDVFVPPAGDGADYAWQRLTVTEMSLTMVTYVDERGETTQCEKKLFIDWWRYNHGVRSVVGDTRMMVPAGL